MAIRTARAEWTGDFRSGLGTIRPGSGAFEADYSFASIFRDGPGTNPIEILGASLAGCFTGALAAGLVKEGYAPKRICTDAEVHLVPDGKGFTIGRIHLHARTEVTGIDEAAFVECAELAKRTCPVAQALIAVEITLQAELV
jgi:osmotically inducible protein OsmC